MKKTSFKRKGISMLLIVVMLLSFTFSAFAAPDFWESMAFGMSKEKVKQVLDSSDLLYFPIWGWEENKLPSDVEQVHIILPEKDETETMVRSFSAYLFEDTLFGMKFYCTSGDKNACNAAWEAILSQMTKDFGEAGATMKNKQITFLPEEYHGVAANDSKVCTSNAIGMIGGVMDYAQWVIEHTDGSVTLIDGNYEYYAGTGIIEIRTTLIDKYTAIQSAK